MKKIIYFVIFLIIIILVSYSLFRYIIEKYLYENNQEYNNEFSDIYENTKTNTISNLKENPLNNNIKNEVYKIIFDENNKKKINDWKITLVNYENVLSIDYEIELVDIGEGKKVDIRIAEPLKQMIKDIKSDGIKNVWVQSAYRDIKYQEELYNKKMEWYISQGATPEQAEELTSRAINKPGTSEHNLGLAVDLNFVDYSFDTTEEFKWLDKNAEKYGFILRYKKEKKDITKVEYEPWHWRYVGIEHAKQMNELDMCLEEYVNYLEGI